MKLNPKVYDWVFWISLAVVAIWMILKIFGVIHSPVWQDMLPFAGVIMAIAAYFQKTGASLQKIDHIVQDLHDFKNEMRDFRKEVTAELRIHDNRLIRIETRLA